MAGRKAGKPAARPGGRTLPTPAQRQALLLLGAHLRRHREEAGITQAALGIALAMDRAYIGLVERGAVNPSAIALLRIANHIGLPLDQLTPSDSTFQQLLSGV